MSKKVKGLMEQELKSRFADTRECVVVSIRGINGIDNNELRRDLVSKGIHLTVVKNSLARRAFGDSELAEVGEFLTGPSAVAWGGGSIIEVAKVLVEWGKKLEACEIKGGYVEGELLSATGTKALAELPSRSELQGRLVQMAQAPGSRLAGAIGSGAGRIAGCIKTLIERLEAA